MATQIYPDEGLGHWLLRMTQFASLQYRLFVNNVTPSKATVLADLTEESTGGYTRVLVATGDWASYSVTAHVGTALAPPISFTPSGATWTTYGYYVVDQGTGTQLLAVCLFDSAPLTTPSGTPILITPKISDFSKF